jgi:hypothetical protein
MGNMKKKISPRRPALTKMDKVEMMQTGRKPSGFSAGRPSTRAKKK